MIKVNSNPLTESLIKLILSGPFGVTFQAEEGGTQSHFGEQIRLYSPTPGILMVSGNNGLTQVCNIDDTCWNGYVKINSEGKTYHLFSSKLGEYLRHGC